MRPGPRPNISVSRPEMGWHAALDMRYAVASHDRRLRDLNSLDMGADRAAMTVESAAPRKNPTHVVSMMSPKRVRERLLTRTTRSVSFGR